MMALLSVILFSLTLHAVITITTTTNLVFGKVAAGSGGSVVISPAGVRTSTGGVTVLSSVSGSAAAFNLQGLASTAYIITLPTNTAVTLTSGANSMTVTDFTVSPGLTGTFSAGGTQSITVGATMNIGANQPQGDYSGNFSITVDYQ